MALTPVLTTLDGVPEAIKSLYQEAEIKGENGAAEKAFVLDIDDSIKMHPSIAPLRKAYDSEKEAAKTARAELAEANSLIKDFPSDFDAEKWAKLKDGKADEAAAIKLRQELEAERDAWKGKFEVSEAKSVRNALDRDLTDALTGAGVTNPAFAKAARGMLADGVKIGDDGKPFVETDMGPMGITEHVKRWAAGEGKPFVTPPQGGGATGGQNGQSTINAETFAKMGDKERVQLHRDDPETFRKYAGT